MKPLKKPQKSFFNLSFKSVKSLIQNKKSQNYTGSSINHTSNKIKLIKILTFLKENNCNLVPFIPEIMLKP